MVHADKGQDEDTIKALIMATNNKLDDSLPETEIDSTIMKTVRRKLAEKESS